MRFGAVSDSGTLLVAIEYHCDVRQMGIACVHAAIRSLEGLGVTKADINKAVAGYTKAQVVTYTRSVLDHYGRAGFTVARDYIVETLAEKWGEWCIAHAMGCVRQYFPGM